MNTLFEIMARNIDKYNLYDHILLNEGAYFFKRGNASISKVSIEGCSLLLRRNRLYWQEK